MKCDGGNRPISVPLTTATSIVDLPFELYVIALYRLGNSKFQATLQSSGLSVDFLYRIPVEQGMVLIRDFKIARNEVVAVIFSSS